MGSAGADESWIPSPLFFVSVAAKELRFSVSLLESTLVGPHVGVDSKRLVWAKMVRNAVCFVTVANRGLRPKIHAPESKNASRRMKCPHPPSIVYEYQKKRLTEIAFRN